MSTYKGSISSVNPCSPKKVTTSIHDEVVWGVLYRNLNTPTNGPPLGPTTSPLSMHHMETVVKKTQKVCRHPKDLFPDKKMPFCLHPPRCYPPKTTNLHAGKIKVNLLQRSIMSQKQYMNILSIPTSTRCVHEVKPRKKHRCIIDICSPRLTKLAVPKQTLVLSNWEAYQYTLPAEFIERFEDLLHSQQNLDPAQLRRYFKMLDRQRKKKKSKKKKKKNKKDCGCCRDIPWLRDQVRITAKLIVDYFIDEPPYDLSFKQLLIASHIINFMDRTGATQERLTRSTRKPFPYTIIEICDKLAVWIDTVVKLVDFQPVDEEDDVSTVCLSGPEDFGEEYFEYGENGLTRDVPSGDIISDLGVV